MKMPLEMQKLRTMLAEMGIKWRDISSVMSDDEVRRYMDAFDLPRSQADISIYRTHFSVLNSHYSVICGFGTYGGEKGELEMMVDDGEVTGWLTAEDIIGQIQEKIK